ncbi:MAG: UbiA family prenyltransferase [Bacteroidia bacterium]|nr:UbiA family prenyltransferase [Bacteroidia bacterium]
MKIPSFLILLRIPFSFYLLPVFLFGISFADSIDYEKTLHVFIILHLLVYPASNGFNSYNDKDTSSIGGLKSPPPPDIWLLITSLLLNIGAIIYSYWVQPELSIIVTAYILASIAYSWKWIRLKKYPIISFLVVAIFQGFVTYVMAFLFCQKQDYLHAIDQVNFLWPAIISSLMVAGAYPMTQIYQHQADAKSGDMTLSRLLGINGTFEFSGFMNALVFLSMAYFLTETQQSHLFYLFIIFIFPPISFFVWWFYKVKNNPKDANFRYTMMLNKTSSISLVLYYLMVYFLKNLSELPT